jgi:DNA-binding NarL/FixJ family response regulator
VLVYTGVGDLALLAEAMTCGARGHVLKTAAPERLLEALAAVAQGASYVDPALERLFARQEAARSHPLLTRREREVLQLLADGLNGEQAAQRLFISGETVRTHVRNAMEKLDAQTRAHAVAIALRRGEIEPAQVAA